MQRVFVAPTGRTGKGLFANVPFAAGQTILVIKGRRRTSTYDGHYRVGPRWIGIDDNLWIEPTTGSPASFVNHSCNANAVITADRVVVAVKPIAKGQEIWIDYSTTEADPNWRWPATAARQPAAAAIRRSNRLPPGCTSAHAPT